MSVSLDEIVNDLEAEQAALARVLVALPDAAWDTESHAPGWSARDHVSPLAYFDEAAARAISDPEAFAAEVREAMQAASGLEARYLERGPPIATTRLLHPF